MEIWVRQTLDRLGRSRFRSRFALTDRDAEYLRDKGAPVIREHAVRFITERLADERPRNDGRQTPWRGHPVFVAQHATATCCRGCVAKWHGIPAGRRLSTAEIDRLADLIVGWLTDQLASDGSRAGPRQRGGDAAGTSMARTS